MAKGDTASSGASAMGNAYGGFFRPKPQQNSQGPFGQMSQQFQNPQMGRGSIGNGPAPTMNGGGGSIGPSAGFGPMINSGLAAGGMLAPQNPQMGGFSGMGGIGAMMGNAGMQQGGQTLAERNGGNGGVMYWPQQDRNSPQFGQPIQLQHDYVMPRSPEMQGAPEIPINPSQDLMNKYMQSGMQINNRGDMPRVL